jgi:uncharacterized membrane protein
MEEVFFVSPSPFRRNALPVARIFSCAGPKIMKLNREALLHETFRVGILLKGIDGALETIGAAMIWLLRPSTAERILRALFCHELAQNPHAFLANHLIGAFRSLAASRWFASAFLLSHGLTKVVLVIALWFDRLWAYPLMIVVLGAFVVYQTDRFAQTHSIVLGLLTLFDLLIVWLTWWEFREQKRIRSQRQRLG